MMLCPAYMARLEIHREFRTMYRISARALILVHARPIINFLVLAVV